MFGKLVYVGVSVLGGGVAKGVFLPCITTKHGRLGGIKVEGIKVEGCTCTRKGAFFSCITKKHRRLGESRRLSRSKGVSVRGCKGRRV